MKTNDLIDMLASGPLAVTPHATLRRYTAAVAIGLSGALVLMLLLLGVRPDLAHAATQPLFWFKVALVTSTAAIALPLSMRLARPGFALGHVPLLLMLPLVAVWAVAAYTLANAVPDQRAPLLLGATWKVCTLLIALLSAPSFIATMWAMKGLAPTRLRLAGATAGLLSGALAAIVYCLHCPEVQAPFIAVWYLLGMLTPAAVGAVLGPTLLRW
jgi:hypothetical protein